MSRYKTTRSGNDSTERALMAVATCGLSLLFDGGTSYNTTVKDNATGKSYTGYGKSYGNAKSNAIGNIRKGKGR